MREDMNERDCKNLKELEVYRLKVRQALKMQEAVKYRIKNPIYFDDNEMIITQAFQSLVEDSEKT